MDIHVSGLRQYRKCRYKFNLEYVQGLEPLSLPSPLQRGSAVHKFMEAYYKGEDGWAAFDKYWAQFEEISSAYTESKGIIKHYLLHLKNAEKVKLEFNDKEFKWLETEQQFTMKIRNPKTKEVYNDHTYSGTIDGIVEEIKTGDIYLWEHKTSGRPEQLINSLAYDDQSRLYLMFAKRKYGNRVKGFIYNILTSKLPQDPKLTAKTRELSSDKSQGTSYSHYTNYCKTHGMTEFMDEEFLAFLWGTKERDFFTRYKLIVSDEEIEQIEQELFEQTIEITEHPSALKARDVTICSGCPYLQHCFYKVPLTDISKKRESKHGEIE